MDNPVAYLGENALQANAFAGNSVLSVHIQTAGMPIILKGILSPAYKYHSIHEDAILELMQSLQKGWNTSWVCVNYWVCV